MSTQIPGQHKGDHVTKMEGPTGYHSYSEEEKTAFVEFINMHLSGDPDLEGVVPIDSSGDDIFKKVHDGILLSKMINVAKEGALDERALTKKKLNIYNIQANQCLCINSAKAIGCSVVNIGAQDIIEGRPMLVFALMWQIIRIKLTSKINLKDHPELYRLLEDGETIEDFLKMPPEHILLRWFNYHLKAANHSRRVTNFTTDVQDGENYIVLLHQIAPTHCDLSGLEDTDPLKRGEFILSGAEKLGVKRFIKPADIASGNNKLNMSFTAQLFNMWPALAPLETMDDKLKILIEEDDSAENREERSFRNWMNNVGIETYVNNLFTDLKDGYVLLQLLDKLQPGSVAWSKVNKPPVKIVFKMNENTKYAILLATAQGCSLVGIGGADISRGHRQFTLAITWQLRRMYMMSYLQELAKKQGKPAYTEQSILAEANEKVQKAGKTSMITGYNDPSIKTSRFLWDLIGTIEPRAIDEELYRTGGEGEEEKKDNEMNAKYAIAAARKIGCSIFCLWEDIVEVNPKMILTMVGSIIAEGHKVTEE
ncbi:fimbrin/plastin [Monocercomonoides exilis]|uniref:fimbrin/plastin n=1 Tax=Monocercomonoides exilis TaxID=2049356 RepID=UPI0035594B3A|nr:fimbrin/plastin [Monocercomonoides exilis]|eukprot:MONOS_7063.1-p1 / transcript=MONOS_7063.1 / gene=MONOS_7063 / organism=Monocercomonoides_exilis_PA203 / gene_product=fimbrin/plastin / transcript_product=fimbrin/plastin / location=Mono_scaffold00234:7982-9845(+) / protein_length=537 / sequence_SO=supercontig / SO=protein_coding / is_pseudo=false